MTETRALAMGSGMPVQSLAGGWIGYSRLEAPTAGVQAEQVVMQITVTVGTARRIRVLWQGSVAGTTSGTRARVCIKEGSIVLQSRERLCARIGTGEALTASVHLKPSAGVHTYSVTLDRESGKGLVSILADASSPAELVVEDLGASS